MWTCTGSAVCPSCCGSCANCPSTGSGCTICTRNNLSDELIDTIAGEEKICNYLDIPIQHCNDAVLKAMRRRETKAGLEALFARLRERIPGVVLRTSLITGLPYEDEAAL